MLNAREFFLGRIGCFPIRFAERTNHVSQVSGSRSVVDRHALIIWEGGYLVKARWCDLDHISHTGK